MSSQLFNANFTVTYLLELNSAVDTQVEMTAQWHGHSSISNLSHVAFTQPAAQPPYYASLSFTPLQQSDVGTYVVTVQVVSLSDDIVAVRNSKEVHVSLCLSICKLIRESADSLCRDSTKAQSTYIKSLYHD